MKRIGILTAGGDTPALNATVRGAVVQASAHKIEVVGFIKGFNGLLNPKMPHIRLNPLFSVIPELDPTKGGTILGASRDYVDPSDTEATQRIADGLKRLQIDGLICVGGDGTLNGLQPLTNELPVILAPKTIDNDLGLNYLNEPDEWVREESPEDSSYQYVRSPSRATFRLEDMVNYATPGYATSVFVSVQGVNRVRTTAESHRRIAIIEVMGRHSGYLALGAAYGQPDIILVPEVRLNVDRLVQRIQEIYDLQKNVVIVCGEGLMDETGEQLGAAHATTDPAGNVILSGAAESLRRILIDRMGDDYFKKSRRSQSASSAIFTRKVGHTQRGGFPIHFDRFYATQLGGQAVEMLIQRENNAISILQWNQDRGFHVDGMTATKFLDRWKVIHPRQMHPSFYDEELLKPSQVGIDYLLPIFEKGLSEADIENLRRTTFESGNLLRPYHSVNTDISKHIHYLEGIPTEVEVEI